MHIFIKQKFIVLVPLLLDVGRSLVTKCVSLNNHPCTARPTVTGLNPDEIHYYPIMVSLNKFDESRS